MRAAPARDYDYENSHRVNNYCAIDCHILGNAIMASMEVCEV